MPAAGGRSCCLSSDRSTRTFLPLAPHVRGSLDGASSSLAMICEVDTLARQLSSSTDHSRRVERQGEIAIKVIGRLLVSALGFSLAIGVATAAVALEIR